MLSQHFIIETLPKRTINRNQPLWYTPPPEGAPAPAAIQGTPSTAGEDPPQNTPRNNNTTNYNNQRQDRPNQRGRRYNPRNQSQGSNQERQLVNLLKRVFRDI